MSPPRLASFAVLLATFGCGFGPQLSSAVVPCTDDSQCDASAGQICFPEGCGDPGIGIVVEVTANSRTGHHEQDFAVPSLAASQNIEIFSPITLVGDIAQRTTFSAQNPDATVPYTSQVTVRAVGESALIPGVSRRYETTFATLEHGAYSMYLGAGDYEVTATADDSSVPVDTHRNVTAEPGSGLNVSFLFEGPDTAVSLSAMLVKTKAVPPLSAKMEVQAFDPATHEALSQRAPVNKDDGAFVLWMNPAVGTLDAFEIVATPVDPTAVAPSKTFLVTRPLPAQLVLEMGAFGQSLPGIAGTLLDGAGQPVANATVYVDGTLGGGGTYRTRSVTTDDTGAFKVEAFLSPESGSFTLTAIPPPNSLAGIYRGPVRVVTANVAGFFSPSGPFTCPDRVTVSGTLLRPDGTPAPGAKVAATPTSSVDNDLLPVDTTVANTDDAGHFSLMLDPAEYRLDFLPGEGLPRRSRFVTVHAQPTRSGGLAPIELSDYRLARGRTVSGSISWPQQPLLATSTAVPNASVRFFRVTSIAGKRSSILLAEGISDGQGNYQVVLPQSTAVTGTPPSTPSP